jgi:hypothetical protein
MIKRLTAAFLCITLIFGLSGCQNNYQDKAEIAKLMASYTQALISFDKAALTDLTAWEDDSYYQELYWAMDEQELIKTNGEKNGRFIFAYYKQIASTIRAEYDPEKIKVKGDTATLENVRFTMVFWADICKGEYEDAESMIKRINEEETRETYRDTITFKKTNGSWKVVRADSLKDIKRFIKRTPKLKT